jgi:hypothetical protein
MEIRLVALINSHQGFIQSGKNKFCNKNDVAKKFGMWRDKM